MSDTIVALCTPQGSGALALIRISGPHSWQVGQQFIRLKSGKLLCDIASHTIHAAVVYDHDEHIDEVMVIAMRGPRTFTGYDTLEITCHNNPYIIQAIINTCIKNGARPAQNGEFTRQAYDNKKIDLLQAEAINELISAETQAAIKRSLSQLTGSLSAKITLIEDLLCKSIAWCESSFEFLDDAGDFYQEVVQFLKFINDLIEPIISGYAAQKQIRQGYRIALIGSVNAGKSSLFNLLIGQKRAIVTPVAGTTRDSIESTVLLGDKTITFIDTAGLRTTHDIIEQEGIERSYQEAHASDIILLVIDGSKEITQQEKSIYNDLWAKYSPKIICVQNKMDLWSKKRAFFEDLIIEPLLISTQNNRQRELLASNIIRKLDSLWQYKELPFLINKRHYELLTTVFHDITGVLKILEQAGASPHYELVSLKLRQALEKLSEMTGKTVSEQALDRVFKEFCVGK